MDDSPSICDEVIYWEAEPKSNDEAKSKNEETETVLKILMK